MISNRKAGSANVHESVFLGLPVEALELIGGDAIARGAERRFQKRQNEFVDELPARLSPLSAAMMLATW